MSPFFGGFYVENNIVIDTKSVEIIVPQEQFKNVIFLIQNKLNNAILWRQSATSVKLNAHFSLFVNSFCIPGSLYSTLS